MISLLPQALVEMARRHYRIELKVVPGTSPHLYQRVEQGDLDCAIIDVLCARWTDGAGVE